jgi:hypothetical protein
MNILTRFAHSACLLFLFVAATLLPVPAAAQPVLSVSPLSVTTDASAGTNAPSRMVQVSNTGTRALKWTVVQSSANWLSVSPNKGTNTTTLTLSFQTTGLAVGQHQTTFRVESQNGVATVTVVANITSAAPSPPPPTLTVTCPANITTTSPDGNAVPVTYSVSTSGGNPPVTVTGSPASGSNFSVGTTTVTATATSSDGQKASCSFSVTVTYSPPPPTTSGVGPQSTITCPAGAVNISPGMSINLVVDANAAGTTFCFRAGVHNLDRSIIPKTGNTFIGEYGAILNGTWTSNDDTQAAFRVHNENIDNVTIKNLVIQNFRRGIHAYAGNPVLADHWTIEYNEVASNYSGVVFPSDSLLRNNYLHHNYNLGYQGSYSHNSLIENNEISYNGWEQKVMESANVTFRNNFIHHNEGPGIWYDSNNTGGLVEGNRLEDNGHVAIFYEISASGIIRNNVIRRSWDTAVLISTSRDMQIYNNTLDSNFRGITFFMNCPAYGGTGIGFDLVNNTAHHNTIIVGTQSGALANSFSYGWCTAEQLAPYQNGSKNLTFSSNTYDVPLPTTGKYWYFWDSVKSWSEWQALGKDPGGTVQ